MREQLLFRRKALIFVFFFVFFVFSSLSLSLSDVLCGVKIFQRSLTKNSATNSLGYTTLTSYPALFLSKIFTFYIPKRVYAHIREVKKSERESLERLKERESVCVFIILLFLREKR